MKANGAQTSKEDCYPISGKLASRSLSMVVLRMVRETLFHHRTQNKAHFHSLIPPIQKRTKHDKRERERKGQEEGIKNELIYCYADFPHGDTF
jgi:hypothetical protein